MDVPKNLILLERRIWLKFLLSEVSLGILKYWNFFYPLRFPFTPLPPVHGRDISCHYRKIEFQGNYWREFNRREYQKKTKKGIGAFAPAPPSSDNYTRKNDETSSNIKENNYLLLEEVQFTFFNNFFLPFLHFLYPPPLPRTIPVGCSESVFFARKRVIPGSLSCRPGHPFFYSSFYEVLKKKKNSHTRQRKKAYWVVVLSKTSKKVENG